MTYEITQRPSTGTVVNDKIVDTDGSTKSASVIVTTPQQLTGNNLALVQKVAGMVVEPSSVQQVALIRYLQAVIDSEDTSSVETAITALDP